jgi:hypothetical protein
VGDDLYAKAVTVFISADSGLEDAGGAGVTCEALQRMPEDG